MKLIPNILSFTRIILSIIIIFVPPFTKLFCLLYVLAGITDMLDGVIARKLDACTDFGSKLDSIGDLIFIAVCLPKILLAVNIPVWLWCCIAIIASVRFFNLIYSKIKYKKFLMLHTIPNKISGFVLFVFPLILVFVDINFAAIPVCIITLGSAVHELILLKKGLI